jgi:hypothetical protein
MKFNLRKYSFDVFGRVLDKVLNRLDGYRVEELQNGSAIIYFGGRRGKAILSQEFHREDAKHLGVVYG